MMHKKNILMNMSTMALVVIFSRSTANATKTNAKEKEEDEARPVGNGPSALNIFSIDADAFI